MKNFEEKKLINIEFDFLTHFLNKYNITIHFGMLLELNRVSSFCP